MVKVQQGKAGDASIQYRYFLYDSLGRLIRVRQPEQDVNSGLNKTDPITGNNQWTAAFSYDVIGNVKRATDANGTNVIYEYDKANRVTKRCYTKPNFQTTATECSQISGSDLSVNTPTVSYFYDGKGLAAQQSPNYAKGKLTKVTSSVSESRNTLFDELGRLTQSQQITDGQTYTSSYEYNLSGALVKQTYPNGREVMNAFEADGDLSRIYGKANPNATERTYANSFSYTPDGRIEKLRLGNGRWEWAKFNERLQVTELNLGAGVADASLWKLKYEYGEINANGDVEPDKNTGNIARLTTSFNGLTNPFVQTFRYDSLYRLTEAIEKSGTNENWKQLFNYDRFGNRINYQKYLNAVQQSLDNKTHPSINPATNRFNTGQGYSYDFNGNLISDAENRQFTFNGDNKQSEIKVNDQSIGKYFYDGEGKRVKKITNLETVIFVYDGLGKLIAEYSTAQPPPNPTTNYTATDMLGSPRVITNSQGEVVSRRDFMPFGEELLPDGIRRTEGLKYNLGDGIRQKFTGYQKDEETGLDFAEARMYENRHARFTAVDPLLASGKSANPQTFNRYVYVMNSPLIAVDPTGLQTGYVPCDKSGCDGEREGTYITKEINGKKQTTLFPDNPVVASVEVSGSDSSDETYSPPQEVVIADPPQLRSGVDYASHTIHGPGLGGGGVPPLSGGGQLPPLHRYGIGVGSNIPPSRQLTTSLPDFSRQLTTNVVPVSRQLSMLSSSTNSFATIRLFNGGSINILQSSRILGRADALSRLSPSAPSKLVNIVNQQYRQLPFYARQIGNGGASDATIYEKATGRLLSPSGHAQKVQNDLNGINRLIRSGTLNDQDLKLALELQREMQRALQY